jgi:hypothetical protein
MANNPDAASLDGATAVDLLLRPLGASDVDVMATWFLTIHSRSVETSYAECRSFGVRSIRLVLVELHVCEAAVRCSKSSKNKCHSIGKDRKPVMLCCDFSVSGGSVSCRTMRLHGASSAVNFFLVRNRLLLHAVRLVL